MLSAQIDSTAHTSNVSLPLDSSVMLHMFTTAQQGPAQHDGNSFAETLWFFSELPCIGVWISSIAMSPWHCKVLPWGCPSKPLCPRVPACVRVCVSPPSLREVVSTILGFFGIDINSRNAFKIYWIHEGLSALKVVCRAIIGSP